MTVSDAGSSANKVSPRGFVTRFAAKQRVGFMNLSAGVAHGLRQRIDRHPARMVRSGDKRHQQRDHHLISLDELAQSLFTCPEKQRVFVNTSWKDWFSNTCREALAHHARETDTNPIQFDGSDQAPEPEAA